MQGDDEINKPKMLKGEDMDKILSKLSKVDRDIMCLAIESGLRISDILQLKAHAVGKIMYVQEQKTKKWKIIELSDDLHQRLEKYKPTFVDRRKWLFESPRDSSKHLHRSTVNRRLERVCEAVGVEMYSPHSTRKLYALNVWKATQNIFAVQESLNHKYVADTCRYVDINYNAMIKHAANAILSQRE